MVTMRVDRCCRMTCVVSWRVQKAVNVDVVADNLRKGQEEHTSQIIIGLNGAQGPRDRSIFGNTIQPHMCFDDRMGRINVEYTKHKSDLITFKGHDSFVTEDALGSAIRSIRNKGMRE